MRISYSDRYMVELIPTHPFPMGKYRRVRDQLLAEGSITEANLVEPPLVDDADVLLVHTRDYWTRCVNGELTASEVRRIGFPWSPGLVRRARAADRGEGYCVLNDIAIATRVLQRDALARRVAIIDCDVHQGNGTAAIFHDDPHVFTFSIHGEKNFPLRKEQSRLDVALRDGTQDHEYLMILAEYVPMILREFRPEIVFYQAGVDPFEGDRLGRLKLTIEGLRERDEFVIGSCRRAAIPVVTTMGGGYAKRIEETVEAHCNTVRMALRYAPEVSPAPSSISPAIDGSL
jgi:acetoin utilization deacetylase AcuC-like enzyme